jgi:hypothetical protein
MYHEIIYFIVTIGKELNIQNEIYYEAIK